MAYRKKKKEHEPEENLERWLLTYSDLITLLMLFFIVLYAMSQESRAKFEQISESLNIAFTSGYTLFQQGATSTDQLNKQGIKKGSYEKQGSVPSKTRRIFMSRTYKEAMSILNEEFKARKVQIDINERGIVISLSGDIYFKRGSAELEIDSAKNVIEKIVLILTRTREETKFVRIEGHTDDSPTDPNGPWPSNWHLASARALTVLNYLVDYGADPSYMSAVSYGEHKAIFPNDTEENRSKNRRVDIAILREE